MDLQTILLAILAAGGSIGTVVLGIITARNQRRTQERADNRADRGDILSELRADRDYWRGEAARERARADEFQRQFYAVVTDGEHAADVASAAIMAAYHARMGIKPEATNGTG